MSSMTDQGDNKDALLEKLDGLIQSGRARKRRDPPPVLTDAIPTNKEGDIPTLTDAVEMPGTSHTEQPAEQPEAAGQQAQQQTAHASVDLDTPLEFETSIPVDSEPVAAAESDQDSPVESATSTDDQPSSPDGAEPETAADLQESISSRLVSVIDREMTELSEQIPEHKNKLEVLQRSLRFALPELVRLRLQEDPARDSDEDGGGPAGANS